jgi:hypothetical protein
MQADTDAEFDLGAAVREECGRVITNPNQRVKLCPFSPHALFSRQLT